jgi:hypothetical protein
VGWTDIGTSNPAFGASVRRPGNCPPRASRTSAGTSARPGCGSGPPRHGLRLQEAKLRQKPGTWSHCRIPSPSLDTAWQLAAAAGSACGLSPAAAVPAIYRNTGREKPPAIQITWSGLRLLADEPRTTALSAQKAAHKGIGHGCTALVTITGQQHAICSGMCSNLVRGAWWWGDTVHPHRLYISEAGAVTACSLRAAITPQVGCVFHFLSLAAFSLPTLLL